MRTLSNPDGSYEFRNVMIGEYTITATHKTLHFDKPSTSVSVVWGSARPEQDFEVSGMTSIYHGSSSFNAFNLNCENESYLKKYRISLIGLGYQIEGEVFEKQIIGNNGVNNALFMLYTTESNSFSIQTHKDNINCKDTGDVSNDRYFFVPIITSLLCQSLFLSCYTYVIFKDLPNSVPTRLVLLLMEIMEIENIRKMFY